MPNGPATGRTGAASPAGLYLLAKLRGATGDQYPRGLSILTGAVPGRARGPFNTAPTYAVGLRDRHLHRPIVASPLFRDLLTPPERAVQRNADASLKAELRAAALLRRDQLDPDFRRRASEAIAATAIPLVLAGRPTVVSGYWPIRSEFDPRGMLEQIAALGIALALPVIVERRELRFRAWSPGDPLVAAGFGTFEPGSDAPEVVPDAMLIPLAGFDRAGHRLGYGKGYYDKSIAGLTADGYRPALIGLAFSVQEVPRVPAEGHDVKLDRIVTEAAVWGGGQAG